MMLDEIVELDVLFQRMAASEGAVFSETTSVCRVDEISTITAADFKRISALASALAQAGRGKLGVFGNISGEVDLANGDVSNIEDEAVSVRLTKNVEAEVAYFVTQRGFKAALSNIEFMRDVRKIWIAKDFLPFSTRSCVYLPWGSAVEHKHFEDTFDSPRRLVRDQSYQSAPTDIRPWYLMTPGDETSEIFAAWKEAAVRNLIFCLPTEIRDSDGNGQVVLKGARSVFADIDLSKSQSQLFDVVMDAVRWVYDQRRDTETKFHLLNNHLALYWPEEATWPMGLAGVLDHALASAREAFSFHLQDDSKEAIKSLGDLRKALQEEVTRSQSATRDLLSALWRDTAIAGAAFALRSATTNSSAMNFASLGAAALLFASLLTTVISNWRFDVLTKQVRAQWRQRLYAFMPEKQWGELVTRPVSRARWIYRFSIIPVFAVYVVLIGALLWVVYPAEMMAVAKHILVVLSDAWRSIGDLWGWFTPHPTLPPSPPSTPTPS
ncbi:hypothetical protein [Acetobacter fabarum]|uniref:hypothetical protein n=1 Tax=Acetobacter fabarum TaxID=483199 RepID=UPI0020A012D2|nr:hypothetical protein [Acetobacter fabarum]MCP1227772.1 hypothetical protein [Acetobacter fabarum]MCP1233267.1 hypothetical protein [Acetobacter fabarum]